MAKLTREQISEGVERLVLADALVKVVGIKRQIVPRMFVYTRTFTPEEMADNLNTFFDGSMTGSEAIDFLYNGADLGRGIITSDSRGWSIEKVDGNHYHLKRFRK